MRRWRAVERPSPRVLCEFGEDNLLLRPRDAEARSALEGLDGSLGDLVEGEPDFSLARFVVTGCSRAVVRVCHLNRACTVESYLANEAPRGHTVQAKLSGQVSSAIAFGQESIDPTKDGFASRWFFGQRDLSAQRDRSRSRAVALEILE